MANIINDLTERVEILEEFCKGEIKYKKGEIKYKKIILALISTSLILELYRLWQ